VGAWIEHEDDDVPDIANFNSDSMGHEGRSYKEMCANALLCAQAPQMLIDITRLQGEARVMLDLLSEALGILDTIEPESSTEAEYLDAIKDAIRAVLVAKEGRPA